MIRTLLAYASPAGASARLSILIFHRVHAVADSLFPDEVDAGRFADICKWARRWFNVLPLDEACRRLCDGSLPARALAITFDDGYADNHDVAMPILRSAGLTATFFVSTGHLNGGRMWNDTLIEAVRGCASDELDVRAAHLPGLERLPMATIEQRRDAVGCLIKACRYLAEPQRQLAIMSVARASAATLPDTLMMSNDQLHSIVRNGMSVGAHTVTHPILSRLSLQDARQEMELGKTQLESILQTRVGLFAYPNGRPGQDYGPEHVELARDIGFDAAVTTAWGVSDSQTDQYQLRRFTPWDRRRAVFGLRLVRNAMKAPSTNQAS